MAQKAFLFRETKRLILRPLGLQDYENWQQAHTLMTKPRNRWDEGPWKDSELTKAKFKEHLKRQAMNQKKDFAYFFGVFRKDDGVLIGELFLMDISRQIFQNAYVGYRIFNLYWGQGYVTEACRALFDIAFDDLKLHRLEAGVEPNNRRSIRVAKALGLRREGLSKRRLRVRGKWIDLVLFAGTCEDFGRKYKV